MIYVKKKFSTTCFFEQWREFDRTEYVKNSLSPTWAKKFLMDYRFEVGAGLAQKNNQKPRKNRPLKTALCFSRLFNVNHLDYLLALTF